jgi:hypothetical protein
MSVGKKVSSEKGQKGPYILENAEVDLAHI